MLRLCQSFCYYGAVIVNVLWYTYLKFDKRGTRVNSNNRTVNHLTRVILQLVDDPVPYQILDQADQVTPQGVRNLGNHLQYRLERVAGMMELLAVRGFVFHRGKNCIYADSEEVEAQDAKQYLLKNGYLDKEFQIWLEYIRKWGMM